jgi:hypothetical protein
MAYRVVVGVPGSGKSFYIVNWLVENFCVELKGGGYVLDPKKNVRVVTNVAGLQIPHEDFQTALDEAGGFETFFTKEYQSYFSRGLHIIYIFDEAQEWFHPKFCKLTKENILYFTWARHEGHDIFLLTQNFKLLTYDIACLSEYVVYAQPRVNNIANELTYVYCTFDGTEIRQQRILFSKRVASLYKSAEKGEAVKIKNYRMRKYMVALIVSLIFLVLGLRGTINQWRKWMGTEQQPVAASDKVAAADKAASGTSASAPHAAATPVSFQSQAADSSEPRVEYYMYRLDHAVFKDGVRFLLGITWMSPRDFPYTFVKKGNAYYAMIPALLLPALENNARALPIRTKSDKGL